MKKWNQLLALSLAVMTVGSLAACTTTETREVSVEQQEGAEAGQSAVRGQEGDLNNLESGQELSYYTEEFGTRGYAIYDANWSDNQVTYDLRRGNERQQVTLMFDEQQQQRQTAGQAAVRQDISADRQVRDVQIRSMQRTQQQQASEQQGQQQTAANQQQQRQDKEWEQIQQRISNLQPGKKPHEYLSQLNQIGHVEQFEFDRNAEQAQVQVSVLESPGQAQQQDRNERTFQVNMDVNPQNQQVTSIEVDENNSWWN